MDSGRDSGKRMALPIDGKRIALLSDLDGTLIKMGSDKGKERSALNLPLLEALREQGITDIFLLTNMGMDTLVNEFNIENFGLKRKEIIDQLQQMGFNVHCVITPPDVSYNKGLGATFNDFYMPLYHRVLAGSIPAIGGMPGFAFVDDKVFQSAEEQVSKLRRATTLKLEEYADNPGIKHHPDTSINIKMPMVDYFIQEKPSWVGSVLVADDEAGCVNSIESIHDYRGKPFPLSCILVKDSQDPENPFVVENFEQAKQLYCEQIQEFLAHVPPEQLPPKRALADTLDKLEELLAGVNIKNATLDSLIKTLAQARKDKQSPFITISQLKKIISELKPPSALQSAVQRNSFLRMGAALINPKILFVDKILETIQQIDTRNPKTFEGVIEALQVQQPKSQRNSRTDME